jgi:glutathione S-transferase
MRRPQVCSSFGATSGTFAPPVVVDGDYVISQSTACCLYVGKKVGLTPPGYDDFKAMQFCVDMIDAFEGGIGKNNEDGPTLKNYLTGPRFAAQMGVIERNIQGPFFFGEEPSSADFFLLQHMDWRAPMFAQIKGKGLDALAPFVKMTALCEKLRAADGYKNYKGGLRAMGGLKDEIVAAFD